MYACTVALSRQFLEVFACAWQVTCVVIFWCTPAGKMRPKMAKLRPKRAKRGPKTAKRRPKMAKMRLKMAKMRSNTAKMRSIDRASFLVCE